jgi:hypothetical protein
MGMFGLIVGTLCLLALIATLRRRRYCAFRDSYGYYGPSHVRRGRHGRRRSRPLMHVLFAELDTTPGQEKAILSALEGLRARMGEHRKELDAMSRELSTLVGGAVLDEGGLDAVKARGDALFGRFSADLRDLLARVHDALDDEQRRKFAELINDGSLFYGFCEHESAHAPRHAGHVCRHGYAY